MDDIFRGARPAVEDGLRYRDIATDKARASKKTQYTQRQDGCRQSEKIASSVARFMPIRPIAKSRQPDNRSYQQEDHDELRILNNESRHDTLLLIRRTSSSAFRAENNRWSAGPM
jgi:hypothetical protein